MSEVHSSLSIVGNRERGHRCITRRVGQRREYLLQFHLAKLVVQIEFIRNISPEIDSDAFPTSGIVLDGKRWRVLRRDD